MFRPSNLELEIAKLNSLHCTVPILLPSLLMMQHTSLTNGTAIYTSKTYTGPDTIVIPNGAEMTRVFETAQNPKLD